MNTIPLNGIRPDSLGGYLGGLGVLKALQQEKSDLEFRGAVAGSFSACHPCTRPINLLISLPEGGSPLHLKSGGRTFKKRAKKIDWQCQEPVRQNRMIALINWMPSWSNLHVVSSMTSWAPAET